MTTLARATPRTYEAGGSNGLPVAAATRIFEGAAVGLTTSGHARPLTSADTFAGFARATADNLAGAAGAVNVDLVSQGSIRLPVTGAAITDVGQPVYATDDDTFTMSAGGGVYVGDVKRFVSAGIVVVAFDAHAPSAFGADAIEGLSTDATAAAAAANTDLLQRWLDGLGHVVVQHPGTYLIDDTLIIRSNTHLRLSAGVFLKMIDGAGGKPLLQNYAFSQRASAATVTLSWVSGMTAAISGWTNHGCEIGDYVWLQGATISAYNIVGYLSAANSAAGTATVRLLRLPSGAVSGTIKALKCDRNITLKSGTYDYNFPANTTGSSTLNSNAINLGCIQNLRVKAVTVHDAQKFCFMTGALRDYHFEDCGTPFSNSDLIKFYGPSVNGQVVNTWGFCGDDGISVQPREAAGFPNFVWTNGDCINVHIDGTDIETTGSGTGICVWYPSNTEKMIGMKASRIGGVTNGGQCVKVFGQMSATDVIDSLEIDTVTGSAVDGFRTVQSGGGLLVKSLIIRNLQPQLQTTSATAFRQDGTTTIESADVGVVINDAAFGASGVQYAVVMNGVWHDITLRGKIDGGSSGRFFNPISQTAGAPGRARIILDQRTGDTPVVIPSTTAAGGVFVFEDCDTTTAAVVGPSANCTLVFSGGNKFHNTSNGIVRPTATPTIDVRSDGSNKLTGTAVWCVVPSGTPVMTFYGWDIRIDPTALTGVALTVGQYITSTQAGNEGGAAVCGNVNGTPAWYALAGGASGANAAIT